MPPKLLGPLVIDSEGDSTVVVIPESSDIHNAAIETILKPYNAMKNTSDESEFRLLSKSNYELFQKQAANQSIIGHGASVGGNGVTFTSEGDRYADSTSVYVHKEKHFVLNRRELALAMCLKNENRSSIRRADSVSVFKFATGSAPDLGTAEENNEIFERGMDTVFESVLASLQIERVGECSDDPNFNLPTEFRCYLRDLWNELVKFLHRRHLATWEVLPVVTPTPSSPWESKWEWCYGELWKTFSDDDSALLEGRFQAGCEERSLEGGDSPFFHFTLSKELKCYADLHNNAAHSPGIHFDLCARRWKLCQSPSDETLSAETFSRHDEPSLRRVETKYENYAGSAREQQQATNAMRVQQLVITLADTPSDVLPMDPVHDLLESELFEDPKKVMAILKEFKLQNVASLPKPSIFDENKNFMSISVVHVTNWVDRDLHPLHWTFVKNNPKMWDQVRKSFGKSKMLPKSKNDPLRTMLGFTPLHYAAIYGEIDQDTFDESVHMLPPNDVRALDLGTVTPLQLAVMFGNYDVAEMLVVGEAVGHKRAADPTCCFELKVQSRTIIVNSYELTLIQWGSQNAAVKRWQELASLMEEGRHGSKVMERVAAAVPMRQVVPSLGFTILFILLFIGVGFVYNEPYPTSLEKTMKFNVGSCLTQFDDGGDGLLNSLTGCKVRNPDGTCTPGNTTNPSDLMRCVEFDLDWTDAIVLVVTKEHDAVAKTAFVSITPNTTIPLALPGSHVHAIRFAASIRYTFGDSEVTPYDVASQVTFSGRYNNANGSTVWARTNVYTHRVVNQNRVKSTIYHCFVLGWASILAIALVSWPIVSWIHGIPLLGVDKEVLLVQPDNVAYARIAAWVMVEIFAIVLSILPSWYAMDLQKDLGEALDSLDWEAHGAWQRIAFRTKVASIVCSIPGLRFMQWFPRRHMMSVCMTCVSFLLGILLLVALELAPLHHLQHGVLDVFTVDGLLTVNTISSALLVASVMGLSWVTSGKGADDDQRQALYEAILNTTTTHPQANCLARLLSKMKPSPIFVERISTVFSAVIVLCALAVFIGPGLFVKAPSQGLSPADNPLKGLGILT